VSFQRSKKDEGFIGSRRRGEEIKKTKQNADTKRRGIRRQIKKREKRRGGKIPRRG